MKKNKKIELLGGEIKKKSIKNEPKKINKVNLGYEIEITS
jgi:hypothetical protein